MNGVDSSCLSLPMLVGVCQATGDILSGHMPFGDESMPFGQRVALVDARRDLKGLILGVCAVRSGKTFTRSYTKWAKLC